MDSISNDTYEGLFGEHSNKDLQNVSLFYTTPTSFFPMICLSHLVLKKRQLSGPSVFREFEFIQIRSYLVRRHLCFNLFYPHSYS